ncbi:MAG: FAD-binding and (Fe-S)-binding domain-containing protein, partial [Flammeovirgaceae bacterium]
PFTEGQEPFNLCKLIAGSEGTLAFVTEAKLAVDLLPPEFKCLVCAHFDSVDEALRANLVALKFEPTACELMDAYILDCTKSNIEQQKNRFFVKGDPGAILVVEFAKHVEEELNMTAAAFQTALRIEELGYHYPIVKGDDIKKVWTLRKAGLGLLSNIPGDAKPAPVIEDTAVDVNDLPDYIRDFNKILDKYDLYCVHYAHAGSGELHLRPIINLKTQEGNQMFRIIADEIAKLVKKYRGSLSGEHGDGRLRGEFIRYMVGAKNYQLFKDVKQLFDPENIFNPNKIVDTPSMNTMLRYTPGQDTPEFDTVYNFDKTQGFLRAAELCNGSGDCRKTELSGGTMCPSYMATRNEKDTTRARANLLREYLTHGGKQEIASEEDVYNILDLCLSCKACKSECPSNVDMAKLKSEFLQSYNDRHGVPFKTKLVANFSSQMALASMAPKVYNFLSTNRLTAPIIKAVTGFAPNRSIPLLHEQTFRAWFKSYRTKSNRTFGDKGVVYFFNDEFTNYLDVDIAKKTVFLLEKLGYEVKIPPHLESGRTYISKGLLREAKELAIKNVDLLSRVIPEGAALVGIEPSAILTLRDEYLDLVYPSQQEKAQQLAAQTFYIDEFIAKEIDAGHIHGGVFTDKAQLIKLHGHCHQKTLSSLTYTKKMLELPKNYKVHLIRSGCCGMAGSFGYEKEHYDVSMKVGELVLFPTIRKQPEEVLIAAPGTSCRHQIKDGTNRKAYHPVEILYGALR